MAKKKQAQRKAKETGSDDQAQPPKAAKKRTTRKVKPKGSDDQIKQPNTVKKQARRKTKKAGSSNRIQEPKVVEQVEIPEKARAPIPKPGKLTAIGGLRLGSGVCNILTGLLLYWLIFPLVLVPFGIVEIVSGSNLLKARPYRPLTLRVIPIVEMVVFVSWLSVIAGVLSLIFLSDEHVKSYLKDL